MEMNRKQRNAIARIESRLKSYDPTNLLHSTGFKFQHEYNSEYDYVWCSITANDGARWYETPVFICFTIGKRGGIKKARSENNFLFNWIRT
jgi:hypothetical protein